VTVGLLLLGIAPLVAYRVKYKPDFYRGPLEVASY